MLKNYLIKCNVDVTVNGDIKKWFDEAKLVGPHNKKGLYTVAIYDADALRFHNEQDAIDFLENLDTNDVTDIAFLNKQGFEKVETQFVIHPVIY